MRILIFLLISYFHQSSLHAQDFEKNYLDNLMQRIPVAETYATTNIAKYVIENFSTDDKRLLAIYKWITENMKYDTDSANIINLGSLDANAKISSALRRRKGVCENYAAVFIDICTKAGIKSYMVDGYTKQYGTLDKSGHAWCAVFIKSSWFLCDPTWDEGKGTRKYFMLPPSEMIKSHMPFDPMWQLLNYPIKHKEFYDGDFYSNKRKPFFNYTDSIESYFQLDSLQKFKATALRIQQSGLENNMVKNRLAYAKMHVELIRQQKDVDLYNSAMADLRNAAELYNQFLDHRNKKFSSTTDDALQKLLMEIDLKFAAALKKLKVIDETEAVFQFSTEEVREKIKALETKTEEQKSFLKIYLNTPSSSRKLLFTGSRNILSASAK